MSKKEEQEQALKKIDIKLKRCTEKQLLSDAKYHLNYVLIANRMREDKERAEFKVNSKAKIPGEQMMRIFLPYNIIEGIEKFFEKYEKYQKDFRNIKDEQ